MVLTPRYADLLLGEQLLQDVESSILNPSQRNLSDDVFATNATGSPGASPSGPIKLVGFPSGRDSSPDPPPPHFKECAFSPRVIAFVFDYSIYGLCAVVRWISRHIKSTGALLRRCD